MLIRVQEVPGIIKVWHSICVLPQGGLDPRIMQYIDATGFTVLFKDPDIEVDHGLCWVVVSEDAHVPLTPWRNGYHLARYRGDARDSGGWVTCHWEDRHDMEWCVPRFFGPSTAHDTQLKKVYPCWGKDKIWMAWCMVCRSPSCKRQWWSSAATYPLPPTCLDGALLFMDKSVDRVSILPLQLLNPISNARQYSWGSAALTWLYRHLCNALKKDAMQIGGALLLVQLWAYSRFPWICPIARPPLPPVHSGPLAIRYIHWVLIIQAKCLLGLIIYVW